ncbi:MAG: TonB-dependent receptor, partial [Bacteroidota bacterium]|nr:TonB-dependent receptor [Bacteroidota bacterium]
MRIIFMVWWGTIFSISTFAQSVKLSGTVQSQDDKKKVHNAVIALLEPHDSILYAFTRSNESGQFTLPHVPAGKYLLMVTHPYYADLLEPINLTQDTDLSHLNVYSKSKILQEVIIKTGSPFHIKGDTTVYTADSFKVSANANVEELLKRLPGIQVDKDGKITAMGQTVQTVLVDGEEFFGSDPGMAIKNIRADAVKEVQVYDKKSDQAEFTGIDDGNTQKTINLKLKENAKHGYFGKADGSIGTVQHNQNRFNENLMYSNFRGKRKFSAYVLGGNTGQGGLSWQDEQKYGGGPTNLDVNVDDQGNINVNWQGANDDEPYVDPQNGYMTNVNAGMFYTNKWKDRYSLNMSPTFQNQKYLNDIQTLTQTQVGDSVLYGNSTQTSQVDRHNFKNRVIADLNLDSANSLKIYSNAD